MVILVVVKLGLPQFYYYLTFFLEQAPLLIQSYFRNPFGSMLHLQQLSLVGLIIPLITI
jgi:hypothetical protein